MNDRFLRACRREPVDRTPVWFMRQAGRYLPEYRALREKHTMLEMCKTPELACEVTLQPLRVGVDAAILFADILLPLEPMGAPFEFAKGEGPVVLAPVRTKADVDRLRVIDAEELDYVLQAIRLVRKELDGKVPLIGFAGAPFTLASYLIEGGHTKDFAKTKSFMYREPAAWNALLAKLAEVVRRYLRAQVAAGVQAVQLFDSWVGQLGADDYAEYVQPHVHAILSDIEQTGVPVIHFGTGTQHLLDKQAAAGGTVIGLDWRTPLAEGWKRIGERAVQGNLDPTALLAPIEIAKAHAKRVLDAAASRPGHVFNLGHGILQQTPVDTVKAVCDFVHEASAR